MTLVAVIVCLDTTNRSHFCLVSEVLWVLNSQILKVLDDFIVTLGAWEASEKLSLPLNGNFFVVYKIFVSQFA